MCSTEVLPAEFVRWISGFRVVIMRGLRELVEDARFFVERGAGSLDAQGKVKS